MATAYPPSTPSAGWHPIHGLLAAYPIACFTGAFLTDLAYADTYNMQWANFSIWLITAGLVMGVLAAVVGIVDFVANRRVRAHRPGWFHSVGNALVLLLSLWNAFVHSRDAYTSVVPTGIILSGIVAVLVLITAWIGNSIVYRHEVGGTN